MRIVFFGTSKFAADILRCLLHHHLNIVAVVTRTDKPQGRSLKVSPPPVKQLTLESYPSLPLLQPLKASTSQFVEELKQLAPDLFVVAAYGEILKSMVLDLPPKGAINVHGSLLPKYRGAAPIQRCLMSGERETGITIMKMALEMDAGDMLETVKIPLSSDINFGELEQELARIACPALVHVIKQIEKGVIPSTPQDHSQATYAAKITAQEGEIAWNRPAEEIHNLIRALAPHPGAWCWVEIGGEKKRLKIKRSQVASAQYDNNKEFIVACKEGRLKLLEVQLEGKKSLPAAEFLRGLHSECKII